MKVYFVTLECDGPDGVPLYGHSFMDEVSVDNLKLHLEMMDKKCSIPLSEDIVLEFSDGEALLDCMTFQELSAAEYEVISNTISTESKGIANPLAVACYIQAMIDLPDDNEEED